MINKLITIPVIVVLVMTLSACAQTKKGAGSKSRKNIKPELIQATKQTTMPGRPETPPTTNYKFLVAWKGTETPLSFFWYHENTWQPCNISTIKNYTVLNVDKKSQKHKPNYQIDVNSPDKISANDTLQLYPNAGGKHPIPEVLKAPVQNTLYYKTTTGKWMAIPVSTITDLPPIIMP